uniref:Uncharacterized protein n=1 Tax=Vitis vinifera TaxID=29760 RepID=A5C7C4_VITVI|nr:hypothetical protein VITISV_031876 [Vitis vinifera]
MTTHEDRQLGRKIMKPVKGPMILGKEGMPQYDNSNGSTTRSKVSEAYERFDDLGEGGYAPVGRYPRSPKYAEKTKPEVSIAPKPIESGNHKQKVKSRYQNIRLCGYAPACNEDNMK